MTVSRLVLFVQAVCLQLCHPNVEEIMALCLGDKKERFVFSYGQLVSYLFKTNQNLMTIIYLP